LLDGFLAAFLILQFYDEYQKFWTGCPWTPHFTLINFFIRLTGMLNCIIGLVATIKMDSPSGLILVIFKFIETAANPVSTGLHAIELCSRVEDDPSMDCNDIYYRESVRAILCLCFLVY